MPLEHEIKLAYPTLEAARRAVQAAGGRLVVSRRAIDDQFFDTHDQSLRHAGQVLRIRQDGVNAVLTWKGPAETGLVKTRQEIESGGTDAASLAAILGALGYVPHFRAQKYREEYAIEEAVVTVDDTPAGIFVEIEAPPAVIESVALRLGRTRDDYERASYATIWRRLCEARQVPVGDMIFEQSDPVGPRP